MVKTTNQLWVIHQLPSWGLNREEYGDSLRDELPSSNLQFAIEKLHIYS
jgi:hypothetical protein